MRLRVDFTFNDFAGTCNCERPDLLAQIIARALNLKGHLLLCSFDDARTFRLGVALGGVNDLVRLRVRLLLDLLGSRTRLADDFLHARFSLAQVLLPALGGRQAIRDLLVPLIDRPSHHRYDHFGDKPKHDEKYDDLSDECGVDIHGLSRLASTGPNAPSDAKAQRQSAALHARQQRVGTCEIQRQTDTDQVGSVDQTDEQKHHRPQLGGQFGLAGSGFEELRSHHADADASASGTQTDHQSSSDRGVGLNKGNCVHNL
jgi:hypothetical protein